MVELNKYTVAHVDLDAFFASVEENDNPALKGKPVVVGGRSNRSIITTANYEARKYGLHSAMPIFMAKELCPQVIIVPTHMEKYREKSREVFKILSKYSDKIEKVSIDEAYVDLSKWKDPLNAIYMFRNEILSTLNLSISVGLSYNKFLAKMASDWNKPMGLKVITREEVPEIYLDFKCGDIHGIGRKSAERLKDLGIFTVRDLMEISEEFMGEIFGKSGKEIYHRIRGEDFREIIPYRERKSYGVERTFEPTKDPEKLKALLREYSKGVYHYLDENNLMARTLTLKIKDRDFKTITKSHTGYDYIKDEESIIDIVLKLFDEVKLNKQVRLIGVTASNLTYRDEEQLNFLEER